MNFRAQWFPRALVGCGLLVAVQALVVSLPSDATTETPCMALKRWAQAYRNERPTLEHLATFDRAHRVAIFNAVTPAVRADLWQEQLRRFSTSADLSATQRALLSEAISLMTPALYEREASATQSYKQFWARAENAFTSPAHKRVWFDLGSVIVSSMSPTSAGRGDWTLPSATNGGFAACICQQGGSECGTCHLSSCTQWVGCGTGGLQPCNGTC